MSVAPWEPKVIKGHPETELFNEAGDLISMLTLCSHCESLRTIILLVGDRWYCSSCRAEGSSKPKMFPIS